MGVLSVFAGGGCGWCGGGMWVAICAGGEASLLMSVFQADGVVSSEGSDD